MIWQTSRRAFELDKTLIMAILNVTPDSFSDGGRFFSIDEALRQTEKYINEGADIIDIGGESTRPKSARVSEEEEIRRVIPVIEAITKRFEIPVSIDTSKSVVADKACAAGAEIINDVSGLRFDERIASVAAAYRSGLILMHLRGNFETMHDQPPVEDIFMEVSEGFQWSLDKAFKANVESPKIALDIGVGFSKTFGQNLELIARLEKLACEFHDFPLLVGASRKSFIGKILGNAPPEERLPGSLASAAIAVWNGARILRVHDVRETALAIKTVETIKNARNEDVKE